MVVSYTCLESLDLFDARNTYTHAYTHAHTQSVCVCVIFVCFMCANSECYPCQSQLALSMPSYLPLLCPALPLLLPLCPSSDWWVTQSWSQASCVTIASITRCFCHTTLSGNPALPCSHLITYTQACTHLLTHKHTLQVPPFSLLNICDMSPADMPLD